MNYRTFWKKVSPLVFPIAFQHLMHALVGVSDTLMLGLVEQSSLSAAALAGRIAFVMFCFLDGITGGGSILAAQYWGKGSKKDVEQVFMVMMRPALIVGGIFFVSGAVFPGALMRIFTPDEVLIALGSRYLRIAALGYLLTCISQCYMCIMKNSGRVKYVSVITTTGVIFNIVMNGILIFGLLGVPAMGIAGAALATTMTRCLELALCLYDTAKPDRIHLPLPLMFRKLPLTGDYYRNTLVITANFLVWGVGITMGSVVLGHLGADAVAANSIASVMKELAACLCMGIAMGGAIVVGNELGAGRLEEAKDCGGKVVVLSLVFGAISAALMMVLIPMVVNLVDLTEEARGYLAWMIVVLAVNLIGMSNNSAIISGIFAAGGDTKFGFICDTVTLWLVVVPLGFFTAFYLHLPMLPVYIIINMDEIIKMPAVWAHYRKYLWVKNLTRETD